jgi:small subunit ribosomal protein S6e
MGQEVEADSLGDEFKGYVFRIQGGFDKDGFAMKQGVFSANRLKLLLAPGTQGYRAKRKGERKRKSVRGCIVGPDIKMLSCTLVKKGEKEIPGLTDEVRPRRLGPKRATGIQKLFGIERAENEKALQTTVPLIKKHAIRRTFQSKKNPQMKRQKAPKIQRLVTEARLRRKRIHKQDKIRRWKRTIELTSQYKKVHDTWAQKQREAIKLKRKASKDSKDGSKPVAVKDQPKPVATKPVAATKKPVEQPKATKPKPKTPVVKQ